MGSGPLGEAAVRRALSEAGVLPSKRLGQNFLVSSGVIGAVVEAADAAAEGRRPVLEIGPGLGALTVPLARAARRLTAVEVDRRLAARLRSLDDLSGLPVDVVDADILDVDFARYQASDAEKLVVVGSIPYSLTAPILKKLVDSRGAVWTAILITQREVAEKVLASPGPEGTALGILVRAYADSALVRRIPRGAFFPVPEVDSTLWTMTPLDGPRFAAREETFFSVVRAIYGARRKTLRNALGRAFPLDAVGSLVARAGIDGTVRGETLDFAGLDALALAADDLDITPIAAREA